MKHIAAFFTQLFEDADSIMSLESENGGTIPINILPKTLNASTLKMWQRHAAAAAAIETVERQRYEQ